MITQFSTPLADLLVNLVRCVRGCRSLSIPVPPWVNPEEKARQFALEHPQEAQEMVRDYALDSRLKSGRIRAWSGRCCHEPFTVSLLSEVL